MNELCCRSGIAPSTFSRWVNGHNSGHIKTISRMDEILTALETDKFIFFETEAEKYGLSIGDICQEIEIPLSDYVRWVQRELSPDYEKLSELENFLTFLEHSQQEEDSDELSAK